MVLGILDLFRLIITEGTRIILRLLPNLLVIIIRIQELETNLINQPTKITSDVSNGF